MSAVLEVDASTDAPSRSLARAGTLEVSVAVRPDEIEQALRLRYQVFAGELGARLAASPGIDRDIFDPYCRHLVVRDTARNAVVGTYRLLLPEQARELGLLYADRQFWMTRLNPVRDELVELGRACVHRDYRTGATILLLWSGIGEFLSRIGRYRHLIGCVSVDMTDGGAYAAALWHRIAGEHLADETLRVWPRDRLPVERYVDTDAVAVPPLMKGYLRAGAKLLGEPHRDYEFGCADFPMMLQLERLAPRYQRRFLQ